MATGPLNLAYDFGHEDAARQKADAREMHPGKLFLTGNVGQMHVAEIDPDRFGVPRLHRGAPARVELCDPISGEPPLELQYQPVERALFGDSEHEVLPVSAGTGASGVPVASSLRERC